MILITGATGLIGSNLLLKLADSDVKIRALYHNEASIKKVDNLFEVYNGSSTTLRNRFEWFKADITDKYSLEQAFNGVDSVFHTAAVVSMGKNGKSVMNEININGTRNIVNLCLEKRVKKLIHFSSVATIGAPVKGKTINEDCKWPSTSQTPYSHSKTLAEMEVWRGVAEGLNAVILNPSVILGPGDWRQGSSAIFHKVFKGMKFFPPGGTGVIDVRDVVNIAIELMNSDVSGERFILNGHNVDYYSLFTAIANSLHVAPPKYLANNTLLNIAYVLGMLFSLITFKKPTLTRHIIKTSQKTLRYSSDKFKSKYEYIFYDLENTVDYASKLYLSNK